MTLTPVKKLKPTKLKMRIKKIYDKLLFFKTMRLYETTNKTIN
jgi:hypothetical protein